MELYDYSNYNKVWVVGDIHGNFIELFNRIRQQSSTKQQVESHLEKMRKTFSKKKRLSSVNDMLNDSIIIVAGDCGLGVEKIESYDAPFNALNTHLTDINTHIFFVRGNHDDPSLFDGKTINHSNIKAIPDYSVIVTSDENILCIGGAISIDRSWRIAQEKHINKYSKSNIKKLYWEDEKPLFNKIDLENIVNSNIDVNFVVTHSAPSFVHPKMKSGIDGWDESDITLKADIEDERATFDKVYDFLLDNNMAIKGWFYGHFHENYVSQSKECIPFASMKDDFRFHNIYENENNNEIVEKKKSILDVGTFGLPHFEPRPVNLGQPIHRWGGDENPHRVQDMYEEMDTDIEEAIGRIDETVLDDDVNGNLAINGLRANNTVRANRIVGLGQPIARIDGDLEWDVITNGVPTAEGRLVNSDSEIAF